MGGFLSTIRMVCIVEGVSWLSLFLRREMATLEDCCYKAIASDFAVPGLGLGGFKQGWLEFDFFSSKFFSLTYSSLIRIPRYCSH